MPATFTKYIIFLEPPYRLPVSGNMQEIDMKLERTA